MGPSSIHVLQGYKMLQDVNQDIMDGIAVVVVKTALLQISVTELQDDVKVGVHKDGNQTRVIKVGLF